MSPAQAEFLRTEHLATLHEREVTQELHMDTTVLAVTAANPPFLRFRRQVVDWMAEVADQHALKDSTTHTAMHFFDVIACTREVSRQHLHLVAMCCLLVAAKHDEMDARVPRIEALVSCSAGAYDGDAVRQTELSVLAALNWRLSPVTPAHFLVYYIDVGLLCESDVVDDRPASQRSLGMLIKYIEFFKNLMLHEFSFSKFLPSAMAAGIVAAARRAIKVVPIWNSYLESLTGYSDAGVFAPYAALYKHYQVTFPTSPTAMASPESVNEFERTARLALEREQQSRLPSSPPTTAAAVNASAGGPQNQSQ